MVRKPRVPSKEAPPARPAPPESPDPVVLFAGDGRILAVNEAARNAGAPPPFDGPEECVPPFWRNQNGRTALLTAVREKSAVVNMEVRHPTEDGSRIWWVSVRRIAPISEGRFVAVARDVTERVRSHEASRARVEELLTRADRDSATGLFTRDRFLHVLAGEMARDGGTRPLALLLLDLDHFRGLNETYGPAAGDETLARLGEALLSSRWGGETYGRVGPDEVGILLPGAGRAEAVAEADRIALLLSRIEIGTPAKAHLTASVGIAIRPDHGANVPELLQSAYTAMERAQELGGARHKVHDPEDPARRRTSHMREQSVKIREAVEEGRFVPLFQPVQEVSTGRIVAVETLARLKEPDGSLLPPDQFLAAAERFGLVTAIDRLVIAKAFDLLVASRARLAPDFEIAMNLSGIDFEDDRLVADISALARRKGIRPDRVVFEITETAAIRDLPRVQSFTQALTAEGFRFALDDFGVGYSSFRYLRELPMSELKFDVSYVQNLPSQVENRVFVRGIAEICRGLGVKTVAEGVESAAVLSILRELGVDRAQGHYIGRPVLDMPDARASSTFRKIVADQR